MILGLLGFYFVDSAILLYSNELVYIYKNKEWDFSESYVNFSRRNLYIPKPWQAGCPLFRIHWSVTSTSADEEDAESLQCFLSQLNDLRRYIAALIYLQLIGLPFALLTLGTGIGFLLIVVSVYITIIATLVKVYRHRVELGVTKITVAKIAFESLACAPYAINIVRKLSLGRKISGDPIKFAGQEFDKLTFKKLSYIVCAKIDELLYFEDDSSSRYSELFKYKNRIMEMQS